MENEMRTGMDKKMETVAYEGSEFRGHSHGNAVRIHSQDLGKGFRGRTAPSTSRSTSTAPSASGQRRDSERQRESRSSRV